MRGPAGRGWVATADRGRTFLVAAGILDVWAWDPQYRSSEGAVVLEPTRAPRQHLRRPWPPSPDGTAVAVGDPYGHTWVLDGKTG